MTWLTAALGGLALTLSASLLALVVTTMWLVDRYDREPLHVVAGVFIWGAVASTLLGTDAAAALIGATREHASCLALLVRPTIAEAVKAAAVMIVAIVSTKFDSPADGIVYGTSTGLGFALADNVALGSAGVGGGVAGAPMAVVVATLLGITGMHAAAGALVGGCVGVARLAYPARVRLLWFGIGLGSAVVLHAGYVQTVLVRGGSHSLQTWLPVAALAPYFLYVGAVALFYRWEHQILGRRLAEETKLATVPPWVVDVIPFYRRRIRADWWQLRRERTVLSRLLTRLAFRRHAIARLPESQARLSGLEVVKLRTRIRAILSPPPVQQDL